MFLPLQNGEGCRGALLQGCLALGALKDNVSKGTWDWTRWGYRRGDDRSTCWGLNESIQVKCLDHAWDMQVLVIILVF